MADNNQSLRVNLFADAEQFKLAMQKAAISLQKFGNQSSKTFKKVGKAIIDNEEKIKKFSASTKKLGRTLTTRLTLPLAGVGVQALRTTAKFGKLQTSLNVLTGSVEEGTKAFERLKEFSAETPFQLEDLARANNTLIGFGLSSDAAYESLRQIGDIAAVSGGDMMGISVAFGQAAASGRLMGQDLLQLVNNGVPAIKLLASSMGVAENQVKDLVSQGAVTFPVLQKAFADATKEGGMFEGGMKQLSGTLGGVFSTLKDNISLALNELGEAIVVNFDLIERTKTLSAEIKSLSKSFAEMPEAKKKLSLLTTAFAALTPVVLYLIGSIMPKIVAGFKFLSLTIIPKVTGAFKVLRTAIAAITAPAAAAATAIGAVLFGAVKGLNYETKKLGSTSDSWDTFFNVLKSGGTFTGFLNAELATNAKNLEAINKQLAKAGKTGDTSTTQTTTQATTISVDMGAIETEAAAQLAMEDAAEISANLDEIIGQDRQLNFSIATDQASIANLNNTMTATAENLNGFSEKVKEKTTEVQMSLSGAFTQIAQGIGQAFAGAIASGENFFASLGKMILSVIGDLLIQMGTAAVAASELAKTFAIPIVGAAAGLAAIALGSLIKGLASKTQKQGFQKFAAGGIVSGPTFGLVGEYAGARSNPEVIAPLDKLKSLLPQGGGGAMTIGGEFVVRGQDLVVALERANTRREKFL